MHGRHSSRIALSSGVEKFGLVSRGQHTVWGMTHGTRLCQQGVLSARIAACRVAGSTSIDDSRIGIGWRHRVLVRTDSVSTARSSPWKRSRAVAAPTALHRFICLCISAISGSVMPCHTHRAHIPQAQAASAHAPQPVRPSPRKRRNPSFGGRSLEQLHISRLTTCAQLSSAAAT